MLKWFLRKKPTAPGKREEGLWGERVAAAMLKGKGYRILGRRVRIGRRDELDLVARHRDTLVFVEVKTRRSEDFARPAAAVNRAKRHAVSRAAARYLQRLRRLPPYWRFDVIEVIGIPGGGSPEVRHIENAFNMDRCYRIQE